MYTLILIVFIQYGNNPGIAITNIKFANEESCSMAKDLMVHQAEQGSIGRPDIKYRAFCVKDK